MISGHQTVDAALAEVGAMNEAMAAEPSQRNHAVPALGKPLQRIVSLVGSEPDIRVACSHVAQAADAARQDPESIAHRERLHGALETLAKGLRAVRDRG